MKIKDGFVLREIAGSFVVVPVGQNLVDFSSMITTNETGAFLWNELQKDISRDELCDRIMSEYEGVTKDEALEDIDGFILSLKQNNILEL